MKALSKTIACIALNILFAGSVMAADRGTEAEAEVMVKKAVALIKSAGTEKAYATFTEHPGGAFKDRDLYIFVYDFKGNCLAQGANPKMVGKNLVGLKDVDGNAFIQGMINVVKEKQKGWYGPYKFTNPNTTEYELKKSYCEKGEGETMVCVGTYLVK
ncbi:cache domain-containing protein [Undibacterium sp. Xuan67W]|uniref:cache domain-containing protein n=1 Tax=Undibacterium sp. Xuan67W TaxID=3413057 RepID=UPI003BF2104D